MRICSGLLAAALLAGAARAEVVQVDNDALASLIERGVPVVDVRTEGEWQQTGVVAGSHLLTFFDEQGNYDAEAFLKELRTIAAPQQPVVFICATGGRTSPITQFLDQQVGYSGVHNVSSGIRGWINDGRATVAPQQ